MIIDRLWRLTRNEYGRAVYDALAKRGVKGSLMYVYARSLHGVAGGDPPVPDGIVLEARQKRDLDTNEAPALAFEGLEPTDMVVFAWADGTIVGHVVLSCSRPVYAEAIETTVGEATDTAYLWRLHVDSDHRQRGIGTTLVRRACREAARTDETTAATALVAVDNVPSQALFETAGFERQALIVYGRVIVLTHRTRWPLSDIAVAW